MASLRQFRPTDNVTQECAENVAAKIIKGENILASKPAFVDLPATDDATKDVENSPKSPARDGGAATSKKTPSQSTQDKDGRGVNPRAPSRKSQTLSSTSRRDLVARQNATEEHFQEEQGNVSLGRKKSEMAKRERNRKLEAKRLEMEKEIEAMKLEMQRRLEAEQNEIEFDFQTQEEKFKQRALRNASRRKEALTEINEEMESLDSKSAYAASITSKVETWENKNAKLTEGTPPSTTLASSAVDPTPGKQSSFDNATTSNSTADETAPPPGAVAKTTPTPGAQTLGVKPPKITNPDITSNLNQTLTDFNPRPDL